MIRLNEHTLLRAAGGAFLLVLTAGAATAACPESESSCQKQLQGATAGDGGLLQLVTVLAGDDDPPADQAKEKAKQERKVRGSAARPLGGGEPAAADGPRMTTQMSQSDGQNTYAIKIDGDSITAKHNGKPVPADRIKNENGKVSILGEDGEVLATFHVGAGNVFTMPRGNWLQGPKMLRDVPLIQREGVAIAPEMQQHPPVMIGVTMGEPDQSVLDFLGIESGIRLDRVVDELPAAQAGLKAGDLIVGINGSQGASADQLREVLGKSSAGDEIKLTVVRKGEGKKTYSVKLAAWDSGKLGVVGQPQAEVEEMNPEGPAQRWQVVRPFRQGDWDEVQRQLEESLARVKSEVDIDKLKKEVGASLKEAMKALAKVREQASQEFRGMQIDPDRLFNQDGGRIRMFGDRPGEVFALPQDRAQRPDEIERLNERIEKLEGRLDQILELLKNRQDR